MHRLFFRMQRDRAEPNQALESTRPGGTPAADAPVAPPGRVTHLER